jgi:hypothetical protein
MFARCARSLSSTKRAAARSSRSRARCRRRRPDRASRDDDPDADKDEKQELVARELYARRCIVIVADEVRGRRLSLKLEARAMHPYSGTLCA